VGGSIVLFFFVVHGVSLQDPLPLPTPIEGADPSPMLYGFLLDLKAFGCRVCDPL